MTTEKNYTIGALAKATGVPIETIRFYEREGVLAPAARRESGYREFDRSAVAQLRFIRRAKELGFTLKEIAELIELRTDKRRDCSGVKKRATAKITDIESKIRDLKRMRERLHELTEACDEKRPIGDCPILRAFDAD